MRGIFLAPSSAHVWGPGGCPAFPRMVGELPKPEPTPAALEGRAAHWWIDEALHGRFHPVGTQSPHQHPITEEMVKGGEQFVADALMLTASGARWCSEASLEMKAIHPTLNKGRLDFGAFDAAKGVMHLREFKFGHRGVDAFENWQMIDYAVGLLDYFGIEPQDVKLFDLRVYQPRAFTAEGPVKRWVISEAELRGYAEKLQHAAMRATAPDAPMQTGPHCRDCDARHRCPALLAAGGLAIDLSLEASGAQLTAAEAGARLRLVQAASERLKAIETGLAAQVEAAVRSGDASTGYELSSGSSRTIWNPAMASADIVAMGQLFGKNLAKPSEPITPKQAIALGIDEAVISQYTEVRSGEMKLKPISASAVKKAFQ